MSSSPNHFHSQQNDLNNIEPDCQIDFDVMLEEYRLRNEKIMPYTMLQVEDVMFIDQNRLVAFEQIFYSEQEKHFMKLKINNQETELVHNRGNDDNKKSFFGRKPQFFEDSQKYFDDEKKHEKTLLENGNVKIQPLISFWNINQKGDLIKEKEQKFCYQSKFTDSSLNQMKLQLSNDKKYVYLPIVSQHEYQSQDGSKKDQPNTYQSLELLAWNSTTLEQKDFSEELVSQLMILPSVKEIGNLESVTIGGRNKYLLLKFKSDKCANYLIFNTTTGDQVKFVFRFENENLLNSIDSGTEMPSFSNLHNESQGAIDMENLFFIDLLIEEGDENEANVEYYNDCDINYGGDFVNETNGQQDDSQFKTQGNKSFVSQDPIYKSNMRDELKLVFFYVGNIINQPGKKDHEWQICFSRSTLQEILDTENQELHAKDYMYINGIGFKKCQDHATFNIPKFWFLQERQDGNTAASKWYNSIKITTTRNMKQVGILNTDEKVYVGFALKDDKYKSMVKQHIDINADEMIGRNQQTKNFLSLTIKVKGEGTSSYVYFNKDKYMKIQFENDHEIAFQDTMVIENQSYEKSDCTANFITQSVNFTQKNQEIQLKTKSNIKQLSSRMNVSISQRHQGSSPIVMYNIGLQNLIIQIQLKKGKQVVYQIPDNQQFVSFVNYNNFAKDLGLDTSHLNMGGCSKFVFLTMGKTKTPKMYVNIMFIDPYFPQVEYTLFNSNGFFETKTIPIVDCVVQSIMYRSGIEVKLIQQYDSSLRYFDFIDASQAQDEGFLTRQNAFAGRSDNAAAVNRRYTLKNSILESYITQHTQEATEVLDEADHIQLNCRVPVQIASTGKLYYVMFTQQKYSIMEIDPKNDSIDDHFKLYEKSETCTNFKVQEDFMYYVNDKKQIYRLKHNKNTNMINELGCLHIQEGDLEEFVFDCDPDSLIITENYLIQKSKIFYMRRICDETQCFFNECILPMEFASIAPQEGGGYYANEQYINGPVIMNGSDQFSIIYKIYKTNEYIQRIYALPDSERKTLIQDPYRNVSMSTFLSKEEILLQLDQRLLLFDHNGIFINQIQIDHDQGNNSGGSSCNKIFRQLTCSEKKDAQNIQIIDMSEDNQVFVAEDMKTKDIKIYQLNKYDAEVRQLNLSYIIKEEDLLTYDWAQEKKQHRMKIELRDQRTFIPAKETLSVTQCICKQVEGQLDVYVDHFHFDKPLQGTLATNKLYAQIKIAFPECQYRCFEKARVISKIKPAKVIAKMIDGAAIKQKFKKIGCINCRPFAKVIDDYLIVQSGMHLKFYKVEKNDSSIIIHSEKTPQVSEQYIKLIEDNLITSVRETAQKNIIQIVSVDEKHQVITMLTWDLKQNREESVFYYKMQDKNFRNINGRVVSGLNKRYNYFITPYEIFDIQSRIPQQYQERTLIPETHIPINQRTKKIYIDSSRALGIDLPNTMRFSITRQNIVLWAGISKSNISTSELMSNVKLEDFQKIFTNSTLFIHYSDNLEMIQAIHGKYKEQEKLGSLCQHDANLPLAILYRDYNQKNALVWANQNHRPKVFELMIDLIQSVQNRFQVTRTMVEIFPQMILTPDSTIIAQFFESCHFKPLCIPEAIIMKWPENQEEIIFASPTTMIDKEFLTKQILSLGYEPSDNTSDYASHESDSEGEEVSQANHGLKLREEFNNQSCQKRVVVEVLDLDWIIPQRNIKKLLILLAENPQPQLLVSKSLRVLIQLLWSEYQPFIRNRIFVPYLIFMLIFSALAQFASGKYLIYLVENIEKDDFSKEDDYFIKKRQGVIISSILCMCLLSRNAYFEFIQLRYTGWAIYKSDPWNYVNITSNLLGTIFLMSVIQGSLHFPMWIPPEELRNIAAISVFILWIQIFYWMRLFNFSAFFVNLIFQTISDIGVFMIMVFIIVCAFSNFFAIMNNNNDGYFPDYLGIPLVDSLISMYLVSLGEFSYDSYSTGTDPILVWVFFLLGTFLLLIVFMNMLIAIMGETFSNVMSDIKSSALKEQLLIMLDFIWILKLRDIYHNKKKKYIVRVSPDNA